MMKSKEMSSKPAAFAKGGSGKMFGRQYASTEVPGTTGKVPNGTGGKFAAGGKTKMAGKGSAAPAKPR